MEVVNRRAIEVHMPREAHALLSSLMALKEELRVDISAEASLIESAHWHGGFAAKMQRRSNRKNSTRKRTKRQRCMRAGDERI